MEDLGRFFKIVSLGGIDEQLIELFTVPAIFRLRNCAGLFVALLNRCRVISFRLGLGTRAGILGRSFLFLAQIDHNPVRRKFQQITKQFAPTLDSSRVVGLKVERAGSLFVF